MDMTPGLRIAQRYWAAIVCISALGAVIAFGASYLVSPSYSSITRVLVRARDTRFLSSTGQDLSQQPVVVDSTLTKALTQTNSALIKSRPVAIHVVQELSLDQPRPEDESLVGQARAMLKRTYKTVLAYAQYGFYAEPSAYEGAIAQVQNNIEATPIKDSYLVEIKAHAEQPELAASIANVATRAYMTERQGEFQQDASRYRDFLKGEAEQAQARVSDAEQAIRRYKEEKSITDISEQIRLNAGSQDAARQLLENTDASIADAQSRQAALKQALSGLNATESSTTSVRARNTTDAPLSTTTTITQETTPSITTQETTPSSTTQVTDPNTTTTATGRSQTTTRNEPVTTTTTVAGSKSTTSVPASTTTTRNETTTTQSSTTENVEDHSSVAPNKVYQEVQSSILALDGELAGLQKKRDALAAALDGRAQDAAKLPEVQARLADLQLQATAATNAYMGVRAAYESAVVNDARGTEEVTLVDQAVPPVYPDKPVRYLFVAVGLLAGIVAGTAVALFFDTLGRRNRIRRMTRGLLPSGPVPGPLALPVLEQRSTTVSVPRPTISGRSG